MRETNLFNGSLFFRKKQPKERTPCFDHFSGTTSLRIIFSSKNLRQVDEDLLGGLGLLEAEVGDQLEDGESHCGRHGWKVPTKHAWIFLV